MITLKEAFSAFNILDGSLDGLKGFQGWQVGYLYGVKFFSYEEDTYTIEVAEEKEEIEVRYDGSKSIRMGIDELSELEICRLGVPSSVAKQTIFLAESLNGVEGELK